MVILLLGSRPRTRTLEQRQVRATSSAALLLLRGLPPHSEAAFVPGWSDPSDFTEPTVQRYWKQIIKH